MNRNAPATPSIVWVLLALAVVLASQYGGAWRVPFINDDYVFLDRVRDAPFVSLWGFDRLTFHWYRPWSREFHYWALSHAFGPREAPFHVVSLLLWLGTHLLYFTLIARLAGRRVAAVATAGLALLAAWAVPVLWIAAVQDLWMLAFSLLALNAVARGRAGPAALAAALALLSKETAATLPAVAFLLVAVAQRRPVGEAVRTVTPMALVTAVWGLVHPLLGGRLWRGPVERAGVEAATGAAESALRTVLSMGNLDRWPDPVGGWPRAVLIAAPAAVALGALVALATRRRGGRIADRPATDAAVFGTGWALLAWTPLALPGLGWHAYYALAGACGAWLAIGVALARNRAATLAVVAALAVLRAAAADTPSRDWGTEWYQRRAAAFQEFMRADLLRKNPRPPPHGRLFFTGVPSHVGFLTAGAPALRVWYRDSTLRGGFFTDYTARRDGAAGADRFFRYDSTSGWREIRPGAAAGNAADPRVAADARELAAAFARAEEWSRAAREYEAIAGAPDSVEAALDAGVAWAMAADTAAARRWFARALATPGASSEHHSAARQYLDELGGRPR